MLFNPFDFASLWTLFDGSAKAKCDLSYLKMCHRDYSSNNFHLLEDNFFYPSRILLKCLTINFRRRSIKGIIFIKHFL